MILVTTACSNGAPAGDTAVPPQPTTTVVLPATTATTTTAAPSPLTTAGTVAPPTTTLPAPAPTLLVWVSGFLPDGFGELVEAIDGVDEATVVSVGISDLVATRDGAGEPVDSAPSGFAYPLETFEIDPDTYGAFLPDGPAEMLAGMGPGEVILGASSARLRRVGIGDELEFANGVVTRVAAVFADDLVGGAELATIAGRMIAPGRLTPRFVLVKAEMDVSELRAALEAALEPGVLLQVKAEGDTPLLRHADTVRAQVEIKERFGEFAYRSGDGSRVVLDPAWVDANIVERELPLLGRFKCHREFADILESVMNALEGSDLGGVIDRSAFAGCWNPRWIADRRGLSRHAWGAAADINIFNEPDGGNGSPTHPELLRLMDEAGTTSGHTWVQADPGHFEWYTD